ncbi:MAG: GNAT family N-acetyltransferase [Verrucomicrobiota bacterium]
MLEPQIIDAPFAPLPASHSEMEAESGNGIPSLGSWRLLNPFDGRWDVLAVHAKDAGFFHSSAWAKVLCHSYGLKPLYFAHSNSSSISLAPIMESRTWLGQMRAISLPFTDFCGRIEDTVLESWFTLLHSQAANRSWKYWEYRGDLGGIESSVAYYQHRLDLQRPCAKIFGGFHSSVRRSIRKAEKSGVRIELSTSERSMQEFYRLHCQTRKRHGIPPQPYFFFQNIQKYVLAQNLGGIVLARKNDKCLAAAVFLRWGKQVVFKFGASDAGAQEARPNHAVFWAAIQHWASAKCEELHLGRTSLTADGLRRFKLGWGTIESPLNYYRYRFSDRRFVPVADHGAHWSTRVLRRLPEGILRGLGRLLYARLS